mgnify:CR=1 FL=1
MVNMVSVNIETREETQNKKRYKDQSRNPEYTQSTKRYKNA